MQTLMSLLLAEYKKHVETIPGARWDSEGGGDDHLHAFQQFADEYLSKNRPRRVDMRMAENYLITLSNREEFLLAPPLPGQVIQRAGNVDVVGVLTAEAQAGGMDNVPAAGLHQHAKPAS